MKKRFPQINMENVYISKPAAFKQASLFHSKMQFSYEQKR